MSELLLERGLAALGVENTGIQREQLLTHLELLTRWNAAINLTAITDPADQVRLMTLDSVLGIHCLADTGDVVDVGSGGGFPGIPLAVLLPQRRFVLVESRGRRVAFLRQVIGELGLGNCTAVESRVEDWDAANHEPTTWLARAVTDAPALIGWIAPHIRSGSRLVLYKGIDESTEELPAGWTRRTERRSLPGGDETRRMVVMDYDADGGSAP